MGIVNEKHWPPIKACKPHKTCWNVALVYFPLFPSYNNLNPCDALWSEKASSLHTLPVCLQLLIIIMVDKVHIILEKKVLQANLTLYIEIYAFNRAPNSRTKSLHLKINGCIERSL